MALDDPTTATIVGVLILVMGIVTFLEMRYLRKKSKNRRVLSSRRADQLPDEAHNALITTRAILTTMDRTGVRTAEVVSFLDEAQTAYDRHNYRVTIELTTKARSFEHLFEGLPERLRQAGHPPEYGRDVLLVTRHH